MTKDRDVLSQIHDYHLWINDLAIEDIKLPEHFVAAQCRHRKRIEKSNSKANLAEAEVITTVISSEEGEEQVFMVDSRSTPVIGKGKVLFKLTFGKVLALSDVLHVPDIRWNLVSVSLLGKAGVRI
uniref:Retrovirus-related Pol polyprotein from transposon TNT 1-94-like beta-barrel domain-containing protein n=1 Tax=Vitis vinifera TaxID=29760 RepID=A5BMX3_VITVI|nr:hypothetical protein VITISV_005245 [Vitis vinifera]